MIPPIVGFALSVLRTDATSAELAMVHAQIWDRRERLNKPMVERIKPILLGSKTRALIHHDHILRGEA